MFARDHQAVIETQRAVIVKRETNFGARRDVPNNVDAVNAKMQEMMQVNDVGLNFSEKMFDFFAEGIWIGICA